MGVALEFVEEPYTPAQFAAIVGEFHAKGFAILPAVFVRSSVPAFRAHVERLIQQHGDGRMPPDAPEIIEPIRAPRIRSVLAACSDAELSPWSEEPGAATYVDLDSDDGSTMRTTPGYVDLDDADHGGVPYPPAVQRQPGGGLEVSTFQRPFAQVTAATWLASIDTQPGEWHKVRCLAVPAAARSARLSSADTCTRRPGPHVRR